MNTAAKKTVHGTVELSGELGRISSVVKSGGMSLAFGTGTSADGPVLVPLMTCELTGRFGSAEVDASPSTTLLFDNVAFLLMQFGEEYLEALDLLEAVSHGHLKPVSLRVSYAAHWLEEGATFLNKASQRLRALAQDIEPAPTAEDAPDQPGSELGHSQTIKRPVKRRRRVRTIRA